MAIIYSYPGLVGNLAGDDLLIISDMSKKHKPTNSVTMEQIAGYIKTELTPGLVYQAKWNANTNNPTLSDTTLVQTNIGYYWIVDVAGTTSLTGAAGNITDWEVNDWAIVSINSIGTIFWEKLDQSSLLTGGGTLNKITRWTGASSLGDSIMTQKTATGLFASNHLEIGDSGLDTSNVQISGWIADGAGSKGTNTQILSSFTVAGPDQELRWIDASSFGYVESVTAGAGIVLTGTAVDPVVNINYSGASNMVLSANASPGTAIALTDTIIYSNAGNSVRYGSVSDLPFDEYDLKMVQTGGTNVDPALQLNAVSMGIADDIIITGSGGVTVTRVDDDNVTINGAVSAYQTITGTGTNNTDSGVLLSDGGGTVKILGAGSVTAAQLSNTITLTGVDTDYNKWVLTGDTGTQDVESGNTVKFVGGTYITTLAQATDELVINHNNTSRSDTTSASSPSPGGTLDLVASVSTGAEGHVTAIDLKTVTWPADTNTTYILDKAAGSTDLILSANGSTQDTITFSGTSNEVEVTGVAEDAYVFGLPDDVTITGELTVSGTGQSSFGGQLTIPATPSASTDAASKGYVDGLVAGGLTFRGTFRADTGQVVSGSSVGDYLYNCPGGAGVRISVAVGDYYIVATAGGSFYCSGATLDIGDSIIAVSAAVDDASVIGDWSIVQSDEGVADLSATFGTFISGNDKSSAVGSVDLGTINLSASGTADATTFLRGDNSWAVPTDTTYVAMTTSTLGLGKLRYSTGSTPAAVAQQTAANRTYGITANASDQLVVNIPWTDTTYSVFTAAPSGVANGTPGLVPGPLAATFSAPTTYFLNADAQFSIPPDTTYVAMTSSVLGLGKLEDDTEQTTAANAVTTTAGRTYGIQMNSSDQLVVNVPWTDVTGGGWVADSDEGTNINVADGGTLMFAGAVEAGGAGIATDSAVSAGEMTIGLINAGGTAGATTFYRGDGNWAVPPGTGVTGVTGTLPITSTGGTTPAIGINTMGAAAALTAGTKGAVPASAAGDQAKFLRADATWATPPDLQGVETVNTTSPIGGGGTGTSVTITHDNSGVSAGTYDSVTVDVKGHVTAGTNPGGSGGGIFSGDQAITAATGAPGNLAFTLTRATTGTLIFDVWLTSETSTATSVAKKYVVAHSYDTDPVYNKIIDTGPDGSNDFTVTFANSDTGATGTSVTCTIKAENIDQNIGYTVQVGHDSTNTLTFLAAS